MLKLVNFSNPDRSNLIFGVKVGANAVARKDRQLAGVNDFSNGSLLDHPAFLSC